MITVLLILALGIGVGYLIREKENWIKWNDRFTTWSIYLLLFLLGISVGLNDKIMNNLDTIGVKALYLTLGAVGGSIILALIVYRLFFKEEKGGKEA